MLLYNVYLASSQVCFLNEDETGLFRLPGTSSQTCTPTSDAPTILARVYTEVLHFYLQPSAVYIYFDRFRRSMSHYQHLSLFWHLYFRKEPQPHIDFHEPWRTHMSALRTHVSSRTFLHLPWWLKAESRSAKLWCKRVRARGVSGWEAKRPRFFLMGKACETKQPCFVLVGKSKCIAVTGRRSASLRPHWKSPGDETILFRPRWKGRMHCCDWETKRPVSFSWEKPGRRNDPVFVSRAFSSAR